VEEDEVSGLFEDLDRSMDGKITFEEFRDAMANWMLSKK